MRPPPSRPTLLPSESCQPREKEAEDNAEKRSEDGDVGHQGGGPVRGAVVTLALLFGAASAALVGTGVGARFHLGQINAVDFVSTLAGSFSGPMLRIDNELPDNPRFLNSTALDLRVQPGNPPMTVNSSDKADKANNLNADRLDNRDSSRFLSVF